MKTTLHVQNLKCGGCETTIRKELLKLPFVSDLRVDTKEGTVSFKTLPIESYELLILRLSKLGYPIWNEKNSFGKKAKSYLSCAVGRINK